MPPCCLNAKSNAIAVLAMADDAEERIAGEADATADGSPDYETHHGGGDNVEEGDGEDRLDSREERDEVGRVPVDLEADGGGDETYEYDGRRDARNEEEDMNGDGRQHRADIDLDRGPDEDGEGGHGSFDEEAGDNRKEEADDDAEDAGGKDRGIDLEIEVNADDADDVDKALDGDIEAAGNEDSPRKEKDENDESPDGDGSGGRGDDAGDDADDGGDKDGGMDLEIEMKEDDAIGDDDMDKALDGDMDAAGSEASRRRERDGREGGDMGREGADEEKEPEEEEEDPTNRPPHGSEVFVGGLPRQMEEEELKELFGTVGEIFEVSGNGLRIF